MLSIRSRVRQNVAINFSLEVSYAFRAHFGVNCTREDSVEEMLVSLTITFQRYLRANKRSVLLHMPAHRQPGTRLQRLHMPL